MALAADDERSFTSMDHAEATREELPLRIIAMAKQGERDLDRLRDDALDRLARTTPERSRRRYTGHAALLKPGWIWMVTDPSQPSNRPPGPRPAGRRLLVTLPREGNYCFCPAPMPLVVTVPVPVAEPVRRSSRRSVRAVRRSSRRSCRSERRSWRRCMPAVPAVPGVTAISGVPASASEGVRAVVDAATAKAASVPKSERALRREIASDLVVSLISRLHAGWRMPM